MYICRANVGSISSSISSQPRERYVAEYRIEPIDFILFFCYLEVQHWHWGKEKRPKMRMVEQAGNNEKVCFMLKRGSVKWREPRVGKYRGISVKCGKLSEVTGEGR